MKKVNIRSVPALCMISAAIIFISNQSAFVSFAQNDPYAGKPPSATSSDVTQRPKRHVIAHRAQAPLAEKPEGTAARSEPISVVSPVPKTSAEPGPFSAQLESVGRKACSTQINNLAKSTMDGVVQYNTMSEWSPVDGDKRSVSVAIGQRYANGSDVPFGISQVFSVPNQQGSCDGFVVQVVPSPLPCESLEKSLELHGKRLGDLAGITIVADVSARSMLIPTSSGKCVIVATRTVYSK